MTNSNTLFKLDPEAQQHSDRLSSVIQQRITESDNKISFADYMNLCLYHPELGYYSSSSEKIGPKGDFTTAPEISSLFSKSLAHHLIDVLTQIEHPSVLEFGAGTGKMAADILLELEQNESLPEHYYILEASAYLQKKQKETLHKLVPHFLSKVIWLTSLPQSFDGVIIANEVCDAMPTHRVELENDTVTEICVEHDGDHFRLCRSPLDPRLQKRCKEINQLIDSQQNYKTEINLAAEVWLATLAQLLKQGAIYIIDYGHPRESFYHPQRSDGTLMCYYQHRGHNDPLILQGLQDITSHVDFTALAETAVDNGLNVAGYQSQADFLLAGGILDQLQAKDTAIFDEMQQKTQLKRLTLPSEMGEDFKALSLTKNLDQLLPRLQLADRRYSL